MPRPDPGHAVRAGSCNWQHVREHAFSMAARVDSLVVAYDTYYPAALALSERYEVPLPCQGTLTIGCGASGPDRVATTTRRSSRLGEGRDSPGEGLASAVAPTRQRIGVGRSLRQPQIQRAFVAIRTNPLEDLGELAHLLLDGGKHRVPLRFVGNHDRHD